MKEDKRGLTLIGKKVVVMIIAAVCILFLVIFAVKMYNYALKGGNEVKQAESGLQRIGKYIEMIENNPDTSKEFFIENPQGWEITSWPDKEGNFPKQCYLYGFDKNCLCICEGEGYSGDLEACNSRGKCMKINEKMITLGENNEEQNIKIGKDEEALTLLKIYEDEGTIKLMKLKQGDCVIKEAKFKKQRGSYYIYVKGDAGCRDKTAEINLFYLKSTVVSSERSPVFLYKPYKFDKNIEIFEKITENFIRDGRELYGFDVYVDNKLAGVSDGFVMVK